MIEAGTIRAAIIYIYFQRYSWKTANYGFEPANVELGRLDAVEVYPVI